MEPIRHTLTARLRSLKMYREELDQLMALFENACAKVTLSDKNNRYTNLTEMKTHVGSKIIDLDIQGEKPGLHFLLNQMKYMKGQSAPGQIVFNELRTEETTDEADALFRKVRDFLSEHQLPRFRMPFLLIGIMLASVSVFFATRPYRAGDLERTFSIELGFTICFVLFILFLALAIIVRNELSLESKLNSQPFWATNKDKIWMLIIGTGIGILGTIVAQFLSHLLTSWLSS